MTYHGKLCDKTMQTVSKYKHLQSEFRSSIVNPFIWRYIIPSPNFMKIGDTTRKDTDIHDKKYEEYEIIILLKLLMPSNQVKLIRIRRFIFY